MNVLDENEDDQLAEDVFPFGIIVIDGVAFDIGDDDENDYPLSDWCKPPAPSLLDDGAKGELTELRRADDEVKPK